MTSVASAPWRDRCAEQAGDPSDAPPARCPPPAALPDVAPYLRVIHCIAARLVPHGEPVCDYDDLVQTGVEGLLRALPRYDPGRGLAVTTYVEHRARGAIYDALRDLDWGGRSRRRQVRTLARAVEGLTQALGRPPEDAEVAQALGLTPAAFEAWRRTCQPLWRLSLDDARLVRGRVPFEAWYPAPSPPLEEAVRTAERQAALDAACARLPAPQRTVLRLYYTEGLTMDAIGQRLRLSGTRISQLHTRAVRTLRAALADHPVLTERTSHAPRCRVSPAH
jgi:RNA polymerase sigma factor FliA